MSLNKGFFPTNMQPTVPELLAENLARVRQRIASACESAGRRLGSVHLLAVTKYVEPEVIDALASLGQVDVAENYVQRAIDKMDACAAPDLRWHLIGHLQSNKVRKVVGRVASIQTVDSVKLVERISAVAVEQSLELPIYLQVNVSSEPTKSGCSPESLDHLVEATLTQSGIQLRGLMAMAAFGSSPEEARPSFSNLRELAERTTRRHGLEPLRLSMGMSNDLEVAIEEGATDVRVGSALYQQVLPCR